MPFPLAYYQQYFNGPIQGATVLASDDPGDQSLVAPFGMYSKGDVETAGQFKGTATSSLLADLAERYAADYDYPQGTLLVIGGECEVTQTTSAGDIDFFGVTSKYPGLMMNSQAGSDDTHPFVALRGRVPVRVIGEVKKGDRIISSDIPGVGMAWDPSGSTPFPELTVLSFVGRALMDKGSDGEDLIEVAVGGR